MENAEIIGQRWKIRIQKNVESGKYEEAEYVGMDGNVWKSGKCGNKWTKVENSDSGGKVESMKKRNMWKWMEMYGRVENTEIR